MLGALVIHRISQGHMRLRIGDNPSDIGSWVLGRNFLLA